MSQSSSKVSEGTLDRNQYGAWEEVAKGNYGKVSISPDGTRAVKDLLTGGNVKLVDFGLSVPTSRQPVRVMQDLAKIAPLVQWSNTDLANDPYVQVVNRHLPEYRAVEGTSKAAKAKRERIAEEYLAELESPQG